MVNEDDISHMRISQRSLSDQWPGFSSEGGLQLAQSLSKWDET
jgi:hypothetical protein